MRRERRSASRTVRYDLESLVQKSLVPDSLERPPLGFDEIIMIGYVRIVHVGPETYGSRKILPHAFVFPYAFLTLVNKRSQTVLLDLFLAVKSEELLNFKLNRKTVCIPAGFTRNIISFHRTVSGDHVLDDTRQHMPDMRFAVGCRRSVIEHVGLCAFTVLKTLFKNFVLRPELFDLLFPVDKSEIR